MSRNPTPPGALTGLDAALTALCEGVAPVAPVSLPLWAAEGCVAADMPAAAALPAAHRAEIDGWAFRAADLAGASSYTPLPLSAAPAWVEAGAPLPPGCDCVLAPELVERAGPLFAAVDEAAPGQGACRAGEDLAAGRPVVMPGRVVSGFDPLLARHAGLEAISVRRPAVRVIDLSDRPGPTATMIAGRLRAAGAGVGANPVPHSATPGEADPAAEDIETCARDAEAIAAALIARPADLLILIGGTGAGRGDAAAAALAKAGGLIAHGIALHPGLTAAVARIGDTPAIALPGLPGPALGACLALAEPVLDRLTARLPRHGLPLPLARKIASTIGLTEIALLRREGDHWLPLATGALPLDHMRAADAWLAIPAGSEGYAAGTTVPALPLHGPT